MTETVFERLTTAVSTLKLDFSSEEFALYAEEHELSEAEMAAVESVFTYLSEKKQQTTVHTLLKLSRLPTKVPRTFENFDFSLLKTPDFVRNQVFLQLFQRNCELSIFAFIIRA